MQNSRWGRMGNNTGKPGGRRVLRDIRENQDAAEREWNPNTEEVKRRLERAYPHLGQNELTARAEWLSDKEKLKEHYLGHLLRRAGRAVDRAVDTVFQDAKAFPEGYHNQQELFHSQMRVAQEIEPASRLNVKLLLYELDASDATQAIATAFRRFVQSGPFNYGPFHAAIQIGDIVLDWDETNLIIPYQVSAEDGTTPMPIFAASVGRDEDTTVPREILLQSDSTRILEGFSKQIEEVIELGQRKEQLVEELAETVVKYNTKFFYGVLSCNCQHFAIEVLEVLGIQQQAQALKGKLEQLKEVLVTRGTNVQVREFNTHEELDAHVRAHIDGNTMSQEDIEFCHCHYLLFHAWGNRYRKRRAWRCRPATCQYAKIVRRLEH